MQLHCILKPFYFKKQPNQRSHWQKSTRVKVWTYVSREKRSSKHKDSIMSIQSSIKSKELLYSNAIL